MSKAVQAVKKVESLADALQKKLKIKGIPFKGVKLPLALSEIVLSPQKTAIKPRSFGKADKSKREVRGADTYCLNQSFLYQSLEERHMSREKLPDHIVMWKTHSPNEVAKRLEQANQNLAKSSPISKRTVEDMRKKEEGTQNKRSLQEDEWNLLKKPGIDQQFKVAAINPYK